MSDRCPACSSSSYLLADGRRQCRKCRLKFTPHLRQGRLPPDKKELVAKHFWDLESAHRAANLAGINRKTAQRIYREFRERMASENDRFPYCTAKEGCTEGGSPPQQELRDLLCGIGILDGAVWVAFPAGTNSAIPEACCSALVLGGQWGVKENFLGRVLQRHLPWGTEGDLGIAVEFWDFARKHLRQYRGNFRKEFPLYLKEMVFRFNNPEKDKALEILLRH